MAAHVGNYINAGKPFHCETWRTKGCWVAVCFHTTHNIVMDVEAWPIDDPQFLEVPDYIRTWIGARLAFYNN